MSRVPKSSSNPTTTCITFKELTCSPKYPNLFNNLLTQICPSAHVPNPPPCWDGGWGLIGSGGLCCERQTVFLFAGSPVCLTKQVLGSWVIWAGCLSLSLFFFFMVLETGGRREELDVPSPDLPRGSITGYVQFICTMRPFSDPRDREVLYGPGWPSCVSQTRGYM